MRSILVTASVVVVVLATASIVAAEPPFGVGSAQVITDPDAQWWVAWVDVSGQSVPALPGGAGFVLVQLDDVHLVTTNGANGGIHLRAHGRLPFGEPVVAFDVFGGTPVVATLADVEAAAAAGLGPVYQEGSEEALAETARVDRRRPGDPDRRR